MAELRLSTWGIKNPIPVALLFIAAVIGGSVAYNFLPIKRFPNVVFPSVLVVVTDNGAAPTSYQVTILEDQQLAAASGHSAFRFLNQAPKTGAVDIYMVPAGTTIANTIPLVTALPVGATAGYVSFTSQSVTMVITPTGVLTPKYTSQALALVGGEVRTILIVDTQLTSNPPVEIFVANDVN